MSTNLSRLNSCTWFSDRTKTLASQLLLNLQIQQGVQLASLLGVDSILYNDEAVYVWVQRLIDEGLPIDEYTIGKLETSFIDLMDDDQAA
jgi:hypothetical protein